jgi:hypothetical protein
MAGRGAALAVAVVVALIRDVHSAAGLGRHTWQHHYAYWRHPEKIPMREWLDAIPAPVDERLNHTALNALSFEDKADRFHQCLVKQAKTFSSYALRYQSPALSDVTAAVNQELRVRGATVSVVVFWGRERYVTILWPYLERNLRANMGIIDEVLLITKDRDKPNGAAGARRILESAISKYPGVVKEVPFCPRAYGCAFDEIMTDLSRVYIKIDDDIIFIKDGSFEHLVYQTLFNKDYTLFSGSVVNNPHGFGIHSFAGAYPPTTYHWSGLGSVHPPLVDDDLNYIVDTYYGKNVYDQPGSKAHEAFIYNVARGRLDTYTFDLWNLNQCQCAYGQPGLSMCKNGYYRWSINAFSYLRNVTKAHTVKIPKFDEPAIGMDWPMNVAPHRVAVVGESLFVHGQVLLHCSCLICIAAATVTPLQAVTPCWFLWFVNPPG